MMNFPPFGPLATAGAPLASTIVIVGTPIVMAMVFALSVVAAVVCFAALHRRWGRRRVTARPRVRAPRVAMPYAAGDTR